MLFVDRKTTPKLLPSPATAPSRTSSKQTGQRPQNSYKVEPPKLGHILEWHKESKTCLYFFDILWLWLLLMRKPNQSKSAGNKPWHRHGIVRLQSSRSRIHGFAKCVSVWAMTPIDSIDPWPCADGTGGSLLEKCFRFHVQGGICMVKPVPSKAMLHFLMLPWRKNPHGSDSTSNRIGSLGSISKQCRNSINSRKL